jgi:hypothetical protein
MSARRHIAIVLVLGLLAAGGATYQAAAAQESPNGGFRLVCPLH